MARPVYETTDDRAREATVAYKVALHFKLAVSRTHALSGHDWEMVRHNGEPFALLEVKCRLDYAWADLTRFGTYMLSVKKWKGLTELAASKGLKICLAVSDKFGQIRCATFSEPWPSFELKLGGRSDRGDPADVELCVFIPVNLFTHDVRVADVSDLDSLEQVLAVAQALVRDLRLKQSS